MIPEPLYGMTLQQLESVAAEHAMPRYAARQIAGWLYGKNISSVEEMTSLPAAGRRQLAGIYSYGLAPPVSVAESSDGTRKYLYRVLDNKYIETVFIPERSRATLCISTQAGCKMGCVFCMTGMQGFQGNLTANEILNQFRSTPGYEKLSNIVFMGMGEPLDNMEELLRAITVLTSPWGYGWSPSRITVSTVGLTKNLGEFLSRSRCHLAVSLHSPFDDERLALMPVQKTNTLKEVIGIIRRSGVQRQQRISFEYILFEGLNDTLAHVRELSRILNGIRCRINLIRFHGITGSQFTSPSPEKMEQFRDMLNARGLRTTIRASRGEDIMAACGMLSTSEQNRRI